jgi:RNA polymerase sigma-70 factor (ECF subfamily)
MTPRRLAELIDAHAPALVLYARQWCAAPEDAVQAAFCKLAAQRSPPDDEAAWLPGGLIRCFEPVPLSKEDCR